MTRAAKFEQAELSLARAADPETSREAAHAAAAHLTEARLDVLKVLSRYTMLSDEALVEKYTEHANALAVKVQSPSGIRSRRAELVTIGRVALAGRTTNANGRHVRLWRAL